MTPWPFALQTAPFPAVVDPRRYYPSTSHENALRGLVSAWQEGEPWISLSGAPGTGKTLLLHLLMEMIPQNSRLAYITQPLRDPADLIRLVAHDWHLDDGSAPTGVARNRVVEAILDGLRQGTPPLVLIEQADLMSEASADELVKYFFEALDLLCPVAESTGTSLWVENMPFAFLPGIGELLAALKQYGNDTVRVIYDIANAHFIGEDFAEGLRQCGPRLELV
ncbi:MAG: AAA family ATPase, partial [Gemmataceae bacterium]